MTPTTAEQRLTDELIARTIREHLDSGVEIDRETAIAILLSQQALEAADDARYAEDSVDCDVCEHPFRRGDLRHLPFADPGRFSVCEDCYEAGVEDGILDPATGDFIEPFPWEA